MAICFNKVVENVVMLSLCKKFGNALLALNHVVFCDLDFTWVRSADKIFQMPKTWFSEFTQTPCFKKKTWVGTQA